MKKFEKIVKWKGTKLKKVPNPRKKAGLDFWPHDCFYRAAHFYTKKPYRYFWFREKYKVDKLYKYGDDHSEWIDAVLGIKNFTKYNFLKTPIPVKLVLKKYPNCMALLLDTEELGFNFHTFAVKNGVIVDTSLYKIEPYWPVHYVYKKHCDR